MGKELRAESKEKWFFSEPKKCSLLYKEAMSWLGTPFREYSRAKGATGGIDCIGLAEELHRVCGSAPSFNFPRTSADYQGHAFGDKVLKWLRGKGLSQTGGIDQQSYRLADIFAEIKLPKRIDLREQHLPAGFLMPGDLLVMMRFQLFHMPIVIDAEHHFVSAIPRLGVIRGTIQDSSYREHVKAVFRARNRPSAIGP